jgi:L-fuconolactonase
MSKQAPPHEDTWPWIQSVTNSFGVRRVMWGSDYPWALEYGTLADSVSTVAKALSSLSDSDVALVFGANARRLFRLSEVSE